MCLTLLKVMRRFLKPTALEGKYGAALASVSCEDVKLQLTDNELVIGVQTRKALAEAGSSLHSSILCGHSILLSVEVTTRQ